MDPDPEQGVGDEPDKVERIIAIGSGSGIDLPVIVTPGPLKVGLVERRICEVCRP